MLESFLIFHRLTQVKFTFTEMTQFQRTLAFVLTHAIDAHSSEPLYYPTPQDPYSEFANEGLDPLDNFIPYPQDPYTDFANEGLDPYENYPTPQDPYTEFANEGLYPYENYPTPQDPYTDFANEGSDPYENYPDPYTKDFIGESSDLSGWEFVVDPLDS